LLLSVFCNALLGRARQDYTSTSASTQNKKTRSQLLAADMHSRSSHDSKIALLIT